MKKMTRINAQYVHSRGLMVVSMFVNALRNHADLRSPMLTLDLPVGRLADPEVCAHTESLLEQHVPGGLEKRQATGNANVIPAKSGIYMFVWVTCLDGLKTQESSWPRLMDRVVLYVGQAGGGSSKQTLRSRFKSEYEKFIRGDPGDFWVNGGTRREELLKKWLVIRPLEYWFAVIDDQNAIPRIEDNLIALLAPPLNNNGRPRLRQVRTTPAF